MKKITKWFIAVLLFVCVFPTMSYAATPATLEFNVPNEIKVGEPIEFTVGTNANDDAGKMVLVYFDVDKTNIDKIEYLEGGNWMEFQTDFFGPVDTGFPLGNITSNFRVTFKTAGAVTMTARIEEMGGTTLSTASYTFNAVDKLSPELEVGGNVEALEIHKEKEFTVKTIPNDYQNETVLVYFEADRTNVSKLQYDEAGTWTDLTTDYFGPTSGFPLSDITSKFKIVTNKAGEIPVTLKIKKMDGTVLATKEVVFKSYAPTMDITGGGNYKVGDVVNFSISVNKPVDLFGGVNVKGKGSVTGPTDGFKAEYFDLVENKWLPLRFDYFGPVNGFPVTSATIDYRVTFVKEGNYTLAAKLVGATDETLTYAEKEVTFNVTKKEVVNNAPSTWDDGGPFTTDKCGNIFDRWGNEIYKAPTCKASSGYKVPNTGVR